MEQIEITKIENYLKNKFSNDNIKIIQRKSGTSSDSVEVFIDQEFIGIIYKDDEEGNISYDFNMSILQIDLE